MVNSAANACSKNNPIQVKKIKKYTIEKNWCAITQINAIYNVKIWGTLCKYLQLIPGKDLNCSFCNPFPTDIHKRLYPCLCVKCHPWPAFSGKYCNCDSMAFVWTAVARPWSYRNGSRSSGLQIHHFISTPVVKDGTCEFHVFWDQVIQGSYVWFIGHLVFLSIIPKIQFPSKMHPQWYILLLILHSSISTMWPAPIFHFLPYSWQQ